MKISRKIPRGFTLMELIIVIAFLAILSSVVAAACERTTISCSAEPSE